ncbi:glycyl-radical enzyme activating protein [Spirochaetia bacterium]|nr:glycyl-radical enzyme activating protein [Spirochaetia bacterium]
MDPRGVVFDIKEFSVFDGPGIRTTVFFKGCPLRCRWCHNPEGLKFTPELMVSHGSCTHCGRCVDVCPGTVPGSAEACTHCGRCVGVCPLGLRRICGIEYGAGELAEKLLKDAGYLRSVGGGYTISGGEPTGQPEFLVELLGRLRGNHRVVETGGFCSEEIFRTMLEEVELVMMDLKLINAHLHRRYTGQDNGMILENLNRLKRNAKPFVIRIPLIPGVNDTEENLRAAADMLTDAQALIKVELLPYHKTAGAKYTMVGMEYNPGFDIEKIPNPDTHIFLERGIPCVVL